MSSAGLGPAKNYQFDDDKSDESKKDKGKGGKKKTKSKAKGGKKEQEEKEPLTQAEIDRLELM